jgi:hypothetical protein
MKKLYYLFAVIPLVFIMASSAWCETVTAQITNQCSPKNGVIVVPAGKTASGFVLEGLGNGVKCRGGGASDHKGWGIKTTNERRVYRWSQFKSNKPSETGGPLNTLRLPAGTYTVFVDGGKGAMVKVRFNIQ